jgi:hypothetical protein
MFEHYCEIHAVNIRIGTNLRQPHLRLTTVQKGAYHSGIKVYSDLSSNIKSLIYDKRKFKTTSKNFLLTHSFYSVEEYFNTNIN